MPDTLAVPAGSVLIVERHHDFATALAIVLEDARFRVARAVNARSAAEILRDLRPDVVLFDEGSLQQEVELFVREILGAPRLNILGRVMMTVGGLDQTPVPFVDAVIEKPFAPDDLIALLHASVRRKRGPPPQQRTHHL